MPGELSLECLRLVYRLLFMFYIEARPELGYVPIRKSEIYLKGYSLESLRDLELTPLNTPHARDGLYFDHTLRRLFSLVARAAAPAAQQSLIGRQCARRLRAGAARQPPVRRGQHAAAESGALPQPCVAAGHPSHVAVGRQGQAEGRVSYQLLSINQLGAVYEALLSYRGFFATEDLYEVQPEPKKTAKPPATMRTKMRKKAKTRVAAAAPMCWTTPGLCRPAASMTTRPASGCTTSMMTATEAAQVPARHLHLPPGRARPGKERQLLHAAGADALPGEVRAQGTAAGQDRRRHPARSRVCEPAMGSAAFLNEAINQLAEAYLERKQAELSRRIPHEQYPRELQKVRMYMADRNVFGVDLNPVAVELAEVSPVAQRHLWRDQPKTGQPRQGRPRALVWLSVVCRQQPDRRAPRGVSRQRSCVKGSQTRLVRRGAAPARPASTRSRQPDEIYHFLLPDPGMANYTDKVAKQLYPEDFERLKQWRKDFTKPLERARDRAPAAALRRHRSTICGQQHAKQLARDRERTEDPLPVWPAKPTAMQPASTRAAKEAIRKRACSTKTATWPRRIRRLKLVMDYWCALWFWPITQQRQICPVGSSGGWRLAPSWKAISST